MTEHKISLRAYAIAIGILLIVFGAATALIFYQMQSLSTTIPEAPTVGTIETVKPYTSCWWGICQTGLTVTMAFDNGTLKTQSSICAWNGFKEGQRVSLLEWELGFVCSNSAGPSRANL